MQVPIVMIIRTKNKGAVNDLNEVMVGVISASWGKLFHIDTELGTKDDLKALVHAVYEPEAMNNYVYLLGVRIH